MRNKGNGPMIGNSAPITELRDEIERVARSDAKVLITGESGVGKELVATAIHMQSARAERPLVAVNCAGVPETLLESELFGHVKGSFTGAYRDKPGKLEMADRGTIFLDEIGEMPLRMQGVLLRFLETGDVQKVGSHHASGRVDVRVVAATNRELRDLIQQGQFREDLFYRLNVIRITVPPLRARKEDIPALIDHFLSRFTKQNGNGQNGHRALTIAPDTYDVLTEYPWPGNVRELENVIERVIVRCKHDVLSVADLPAEVQAQRGVALRPKRERRRTVADQLYQRLTEERQSFWTLVHPLYMQREITRENLRDLVRKGLEQSCGNYKVVAQIFNIEANEYKRFLNFLRKHDCQIPFKDYRVHPRRMLEASDR
jgi:transcriptional regulator with PAS, ATPase and Fis domain